MRRRDFIALVGGVTAVWPLAAHAKVSPKVPTVGFLGPSTPSVASGRIAAFEERLKELGWIGGRNVIIEYRWADGKPERYEPVAGELVRLNVDVIVTWGTETALAAKRQTSVIPIVFTIVGDPVGSGLVSSLRRPGGNITGLSTQHPDAAEKRIELLRMMVPNCRRLAILGNYGNPGPLSEMRESKAAALKIGMEVIELDVRRLDDIAPAFARIENLADTLLIASDAFLTTNRDKINSLALDARLPTMQGYREAVVAGGLMSYAPNYLELFRGAAKYVDKILHGTKPADIPVEQPTKFDLVINRKTAKVLGLSIPDKLIALADEVIE
jgi:putative tryptophan/tyrosine transport system substrate-binding protein